ncbi:pilus assembly protein N-terminal domain-containing protein [Anaerorudis cellulosivorans]|uniref:pilus assembly protein N-terminal domain-containing protein n=1 Tax=Anaerorudis cellulosivorans TaxID=3397862 RepID=UPI00221F9D76|nr:pilus assembly protein N-terminal domain-containing protein [Seramator thermalis]MCW1735430.1 pilus assembly protein N-terminal domain-containing protein [Seramator thermalis]
MKRFSIYVVSLMLSGTFFIACDDDESNGKLTFDKNSVEVFVGEETVMKVRGGVAPYTATPADETIAEATVDGGDITIKGVKEGTTTVKVTDKNGLEATIAVEVKEDPYENEKGDATVRIKWDTYEKIEGRDEGIFLLTKAEDKTVTFSWTNEEEVESLVLTFKDTEDKIGAEGNEEESASGKEDATPVGKLTVTVDGESTDYDVTSFRLVQAKPADDEEGTPITYWIAFTADNKSGLAVAPLTVETE